MKATTPAVLCFLLLAGPASAATSESKNPTSPAVTMPAAEDAFEASLVKPPADPEALAGYAILLANKAYAAPDPAAARQLRKRAHEFATAAQQGGSKHVLIPLLLREILPDGSQVPPQLSANPKVNDLLRDAEAKFARHDLDGALEGYQQALREDPHCAAALVFGGDVHFVRGEFPEAIQWFELAIGVDPWNEPAHRYRADALMRLGRIDEAGMGYVDAFLTRPFADLPTRALNSWLNRKHLRLSRPQASFLGGGIHFEKQEVQLVVDEKRQNVLSVAYLVGRAGYISQHKLSPPEYRRSLAEEMVGFDCMLEVAEGMRQEGKDSPDLAPYLPEIDRLLAIKRRGMIECYLFLDQPNEEVLKDYREYWQGHRGLLRDYVRQFWLNLPDSSPVATAPGR